MSKKQQKAAQAQAFSVQFDNADAQRQIAATTGATVPAPDDLASGKKSTLGISLTASEIEYLSDIASHHDLARHALLRFAVRRFLVSYRAGEVDLASNVTPPAKRPKNSLKTPY